MTAIHFDQRLRAGADNVEITSLGVGQGEEIHVWAWIECTQHTVDVNGIRRRIDIQSLRNHHLEYVAVDDMLLGSLNGLLILGFRRSEP